MKSECEMILCGDETFIWNFGFFFWKSSLFEIFLFGNFFGNFGMFWNFGLDYYSEIMFDNFGMVIECSSVEVAVPRHIRQLQVVD